MTTLIIQHRTGGDVVRALHELSSTLDARRETLREVRTVMAGAVYTSYIVPLLGVGSLFVLNAINSRTLSQMTTEPVGIAALVVAAILYALGWVAIKRRRGSTCDRPGADRPGGCVLLRRGGPRARAAAQRLAGRAARAERRARRGRPPTRSDRQLLDLLARAWTVAAGPDERCRRQTIQRRLDLAGRPHG